MPSSPLTRSAIGAVLLFVIAILSWEIFLRQSGSDHGFDDAAPLWAHIRGQVYEPKEQSTVFIGSSRIKFDLDIPTWHRLTGGDHAVQLACVGSTPLPVLYDLAKDVNFNGKLVIDVTEGLFFSTSPGSADSPDKYIKYYHDLTPAQRASFVLNRPMESTFVFLDKDNYSINAMLDKMELKSREGVFMSPIFPRDFDRTDPFRQSSMKPAFVADTNQHRQVKNIWKFFASRRKGPPISGMPLDSMIHEVKKATDRIKSRGGQVVFVRTPSSGTSWEKESEAFPRELYWDKLIAVTQCPGIHFGDDIATAYYKCPEDSHLSPKDAVAYTKILLQHLQADAGWRFPKIALH